MVAGPLVGYLAGVYLRDKFRLGDRAVAIAVFIGLAASVMEAVRVIRLIIRLGGEP
jgi:hypothetical protein